MTEDQICFAAFSYFLGCILSFMIEVEKFSDRHIAACLFWPILFVRALIRGFWSAVVE